VDGGKLLLSGQVSAADTQKLIDFYDALRKAQLDGKPFFNPNPSGSDQLSFRQQANNQTWSFGLELLHAEEEQQ
jgi:hypothetical protein